MADDSLKTELAARLDPICQQFEAACQAGEQPAIDEFAALANLADREALRAELGRIDCAFRQRQAHLADSRSEPSTLSGARSMDGNGDEYLTTPPNVSAATEPASDLPNAFGRYRVTGRLGRGACGVVYRGHDPDLRRDVAIKVPRRDRIASPADAEAYLAEARVLATLNHPGIVQVHDFGRTEDGLCYVVSQFIGGGDLARRIALGRPSHEEAADLLARIADALHHAHRHGLVHRDIKPGNILIDQTGRPLVADFGLALSDESYGRRAGVFGTPAYMSPEQARGEGHRVDARSDIYSLGVVFYELLTGRRPYRHHTLPELLDEMSSGETRPPRQLDHTIPKELERICLKALAKRAADRYTTAFDLAEDLRHWAEGGERRVEGGEWRVQGETSVTSRHAPPATLHPKIIPKGLRSFDAHDADFFLQLLPGPTDRDGLPESIRFWKTRIESFDADETFSVGLLYGPSGCGKSSLVKAGLLPRLAQHVTTIFLEATPDDTEARLMAKVAGTLRVPSAEAATTSHDTDLPGAIAQLRRSAAREKADGTPPARGYPVPATMPATKILIVIDQFEQWLHAHRDPGNTELIRALRQCDGAHVQCLVMVRDDFWMAASRFMQALEIPLLEGVNSAAVDLFDTLHARKVLTLFGGAYGRLPSDSVGNGLCAVPQSALTTDHDQFLDAAVAGLAEDGKVVSVRLALFAEMVKGKPWTPATLKEIGGISGVGVTFLEETFSASTAPPRHRAHQEAARAVLKALLPEAGSDIKGHRRSREELLSASGYARREAAFSELLRILDSELRLITPADDVGAVEPDTSPHAPREGEHHAERDAYGTQAIRASELAEPQGSREAAKARREEFRLLRAFAASRESSAETSRDEPAESADDNPKSNPGAPGENPKSYQLTHDYLVPSLRDWLTRKQRETRRGRAELRLAERAALWVASPKLASLPTFVEWCSIHCLTKSRHWSPAQRGMMRAASKQYCWRAIVPVILFCAAAYTGYEIDGRLRADLILADSDWLRHATTEQLRGYGRWLTPRLCHKLEASKQSGNWGDFPTCAAGLARVDPANVRELRNAIRVAPLETQETTLKLIQDHASDWPGADAVISGLLEEIWQAISKNAALDPARQNRLLLLLARRDPTSARWEHRTDDLAKALLREDLQPNDLYRYRDPYEKFFRDFRYVDALVDSVVTLVETSANDRSLDGSAPATQEEVKAIAFPLRLCLSTERVDAAKRLMLAGTAEQMRERGRRLAGLRGGAFAFSLDDVLDSLEDDVSQPITAEASSANNDEIMLRQKKAKLFLDGYFAAGNDTTYALHLAQRERWDLAATLWANIAEKNADDPWWLYGQALCERAGGRLDRYLATRRRLYGRFSDSTSRGVCTCLVSAFTFAHPDPQLSSQIVEIARRCDVDDTAASKGIVGAALYRNGQYAEAVAKLTEATKADRPRPWDFDFLQIAEAKLGHLDEANQASKAMVASKWGFGVNHEAAGWVLFFEWSALQSEVAQTAFSAADGASVEDNDN